MCKDSNVVLDDDYLDNDVQCYCVDGIHGTLKELADYFNVDPISVSDLLLSGQNIQDALCMADIGFKPLDPVIKKELKQDDLKTSDESKKSSIPESKKTEKLEIKKVESKKDIIPKPVKSVSKDVNDVISTKSVSDVQDLGDIVIITTMTTVVYRKAGV